MARAVEGEVDAFVGQALAPHPPAKADLVEQVDRALLEHARANARLDIGARVALQDNGFDACAVKQMAEQQAGRTGPDNSDLGAILNHFFPAKLAAYPPAGLYCYMREHSRTMSLERRWSVDRSKRKRTHAVDFVLSPRPAALKECSNRRRAKRIPLTPLSRRNPLSYIGFRAAQGGHSIIIRSVLRRFGARNRSQKG